MIDFAAPIRTWMPASLYEGFLDGLPDILLATWPLELGQEHRYKTWICETPEELTAVQAALDRPVPQRIGPRGMEVDFRAGPNHPVSRLGHGAKPYGETVIAIYPPPDPGLPWLVLFSAPMSAVGYERGRYAWQTFDTEAEALTHVTGLRAQIGPFPVHIITPPPHV